MFEVDRLPVALAPLEFWVANAPPSAGGGLAIGMQSAPVPILGAQLTVLPQLFVPIASNAAGTFSLPLLTPPGLTGSLALQTIWVNVRTCAGSQLLSSSAGLKL